MTEVTWTACHATSLTPSRGKGLKLLGLDINATDAYTLTTGLTEISGIALTSEDADFDADTMYAAAAISGGTITFHTGKTSNNAATAAADFRMLVMGIVR